MADPELVKVQTVTMVVQVNGKVRDRLEVDPDIDEAEAERLALASRQGAGGHRRHDAAQGHRPPAQAGQPRRFVRIAPASGATLSSDDVVKGPYRSDAP